MALPKPSAELVLIGVLMAAWLALLPASRRRKALEAVDDLVERLGTALPDGHDAAVEEARAYWDELRPILATM